MIFFVVTYPSFSPPSPFLVRGLNQVTINHWAISCLFLLLLLRQDLAKLLRLISNCQSSFLRLPNCWDHRHVPLHPARLILFYAYTHSGKTYKVPIKCNAVLGVGHRIEQSPSRWPLLWIAQNDLLLGSHQASLGHRQFVEAEGQAVTAS